MAQVLKDEIKEKIKEAALQEFYKNGYQSTTMRNIAEKANIPTGLIYSYYKNKEDLFHAILIPVLYDWEQVLAAEDKEDHTLQTDGVIYGLSKTETECLLHLFDHRQEFIILIDKSKGTKYEKEREHLTKEIQRHLQAHAKENYSDSTFLHIVASNFVDGILQTMYCDQGKEWAIMILHKLSKMYLSGIGY